MECNSGKNRQISKRALELQEVTDKLKELWRDTEGPFQNIFRFMSHLIPFIPGLGWGVYFFETIASMFGWGMGDIGGALDKAMGLAPGEHLETPSSTDIGTGIESVMKKAASSGDDGSIKKVASVMGLVRLVGGIPKVANLLWKAIKFLMLAWGVTKLGDLYSSKTGKKPGEAVLEQVGLSGDSDGDGDAAGTPFDPSKILNIVKDPTILTGLFGG